MKHIRTLTQTRPAMAQFEPVLQFIGIIQSILGTPSILISNLGGLLNLIGGAVNILTGWEQLQQLKEQGNP